MLVSDSDVLLLEQLRQGDKKAFECLFLRHYAQVYRALYGLVRTHEEAEDLAQETFLTLYHRPPSAGVPLVGWLCRVALNRGYNALRSYGRAQRRVEQLGEFAESSDPAMEVMRAEERAYVREVIAQLPNRQGAVLLLRYAGLSYAEIATALEVAPGSVGTLLARAERAFLAAYGPTEVSDERSTWEMRLP